MKIVKITNSITIEFTDVELKILANDLLDPLGHFEIVAREKLANCKTRLLNYWLTKFQQEKSVENIPTDEIVLLDLIFSQLDYKSRQKGDLEEMAKLGIKLSDNSEAKR